jgi:Gpi18-like mannosyltransferase
MDSKRTNYFAFDKETWTITGVLLLAVLCRVALFDFESWDYKSILSKWYEHLMTEGRWRGLGTMNSTFFSYPSLYMSGLSLASWLPVPDLYAIKLLSVVFDFVGGYFVFQIGQLLGHSRKRALVIAGVVLFLPTVVINASMWGQCDMMYVSCFLWSFLEFLRKRPARCLLAFGFAIALKPQAVFWMPFLGGLLFAGQIKVRHLAVSAVVYAACGLPEILAGRNWAPVLFHWLRMENQPGLTLNAPNWYQWFSPHEAYLAYLGKALAMIVGCIWRRKLYAESPERLMPVVLLGLISIPFLLPGMHERYFFPADVFSILYAFSVPKRWWVALYVQGASLLSQFPFLFRAEPVPLGCLAIVLVVIILCITIDIIRIVGELSASAKPKSADRGVACGIRNDSKENVVATYDGTV